MTAGPVDWRASRALFAGILRRHGLDPEAVDDVEAAWAAFEEFAQVPVVGVADVADDGDGFIAEWGSYSWNDGLPSLCFGRQFAVPDREAGGQPQYWRVDLELCFAARPDLAGVGALEVQDTGFDFPATGPARAAALAGARALVHGYPQLVAMWRSRPVRSRLTLDQAG
ncbi:hypothetical protein [Kitasatospora viridis]|uniref:Uncharacterized protein n=1 Tax=Kitasatospora viridis TaxID=281105 RepID=A0A561T6V5_9ACTN|nr:hypothetical protein [Kitasatospora viridis]TWF82837.1 hypothetical protein FHX73_14319 [Kitasatospora viridis]